MPSCSEHEFGQPCCWHRCKYMYDSTGELLPTDRTTTDMCVVFSVTHLAIVCHPGISVEILPMQAEAPSNPLKKLLEFIHLGNEAISLKFLAYTLSCYGLSTLVCLHVGLRIQQ